MRFGNFHFKNVEDWTKRYKLWTFLKAYCSPVLESEYSVRISTEFMFFFLIRK